MHEERPVDLPHLWQKCLPVRAVIIIVLFAALSGAAAAEEVPLPQPRPVPAAAEVLPAIEPAELTTEPSDCFKRLSQIASVMPLPRLFGPGSCGGSDMVRLESVLMPDKSRVPLLPAAELRCPMAEQVAIWMREDLSAHARELGSALKSIENYDAYECRGRNRATGGKISEHGKGNALDVRALTLVNGRIVEPTDIHVAKPVRESMRQSACSRFTTVLGPGSDGYHESHIHLDLAERRNGHRMCQWDVREPVVVAESTEAALDNDDAVDVPLPRPRPTFRSDYATALPTGRR